MAEEKPTRDPVEVVARAMALSMGCDPDACVRATGYSDSLIIPAWRREREWASRFLAGISALNDLRSDEWRYEV